MIQDSKLSIRGSFANEDNLEQLPSENLLNKIPKKKESKNAMHKSNKW